MLRSRCVASVEGVLAGPLRVGERGYESEVSPAILSPAVSLCRYSPAHLGPLPSEVCALETLSWAVYGPTGCLIHSSASCASCRPPMSRSQWYLRSSREGVVNGRVLYAGRWHGSMSNLDDAEASVVVMGAWQTSIHSS